MNDNAISIRFSAKDGRVGIGTAVAVLVNVSDLLDASARRAEAHEGPSLAHSSDASRDASPLVMRLDSVNDGSVEMVLALVTPFLGDPEAWFNTVMYFMWLTSPYLVPLGGKFLEGAVFGAGELTTKLVGKAVSDRRRRYGGKDAAGASDDSDNAVLETGRALPEMPPAFKRDERVSMKVPEGVDVDLLEDFFTDSAMMNSALRVQEALERDPQGLDFSIEVGGGKVYDYAPFADDGVRASDAQVPQSASFTERPACVVWRPDLLRSGVVGTEPIDGKVHVTYEGAEKSAKVDSDALSAAWGQPLESIPPGSRVQVLLSGKSVFNSAERCFYSRNLSIDEILGIEER